jgi:fucose permease
MYWYGWTLSVVVGGAIVSFVAAMLPERVTRKIPLYLVWVLPVFAVVLLAYSLREFWLR